MNVNNQLGSRPGIRLFPGHSAGGSFSGNSGIIGGGAPTMDAFQAKTHTSQNDASRILKQMQAERQQNTTSSSTYQSQCAAPEPPTNSQTLTREPVYSYGSGPSSHYQQENFPEKPAPMARPAPTHEPPPTISHRAHHHDSSTATSLVFGGQGQGQGQPSRNARRMRNGGDSGAPEWMGAPPQAAAPPRQSHADTSKPDWMGGSSQQTEAKPRARHNADSSAPDWMAPPGQRRQIIDCSPPGSREGGIPGLNGQKATVSSSSKPAGGMSAMAEGISFGGYDSRLKDVSDNDRSHMAMASQARLKSRPF